MSVRKLSDIITMCAKTTGYFKPQNNKLTILLILNQNNIYIIIYIYIIVLLRNKYHKVMC